jgi:hypothetical protein
LPFRGSGALRPRAERDVEPARCPTIEKKSFDAVRSGCPGSMTDATISCSERPSTARASGSVCQSMSASANAAITRSSTAGDSTPAS